MIPLPLVPACGECNVCCTVLGIASLGKPYYCDCKSLKSGKCKVYGSHPKDCQEYDCAWRILRALPERYRPDKVGVLFHFDSDEHGLWLEAYEVRENSLLGPEVGEIIDHIMAIFKRYPDFRGQRFIRFNSLVPLAATVSDDYPDEGVSNQKRLWGVLTADGRIMRLEAPIRAIG